MVDLCSSVGPESKYEKKPSVLSSGSSLVTAGCVELDRFAFLCLVALRAACILDCTFGGTSMTLFPLPAFGSGKKEASPDFAPAYIDNNRLAYIYTM